MIKNTYIYQNVIISLFSHAYFYISVFFSIFVAKIEPYETFRTYPYRKNYGATTI